MNGPQNLPYGVPQVPAQFYGQQHGTWGIEYDFKTRPIEDDLPDGWSSRRSSLYRKVGKKLRENGFHRAQYSCWRKNCGPANCFISMFSIFNIVPCGITESTVLGLAMYRIPLESMDVTQSVVLGGAYSRRLRGLTPARLTLGVQDILEQEMDRPLAIPEEDDLDPLPSGVQDTENSNNVINWRH